MAAAGTLNTTLNTEFNREIFATFTTMFCRFYLGFNFQTCRGLLDYQMGDFVDRVFELPLSPPFICS
jgi:hypothetical protein